jgi:metal-sulfur cluster biosynthetic enzyme
VAEITKEQVVEVLKTVYDPEIPVNIYDLGLIYDVDVEGNEVNVVMTLTSPSCPAAGEIPTSVEQRVCGTLNAEKCLVHLVWSPPWSPEKISPEGKKILGLADDGAPQMGDPPAPPSGSGDE